MLRKTTATCSAGKYRTRTAAPGINAAISVISTVYNCGVFGRGAFSPAHEFLAVASCGLLPRTTRPGPRLRTAFWSVAILPLRDTDSGSRVADALDLCEGCIRRPEPRSIRRWTNMAPTAKALATPACRGCGLATDQKAVRRRGPGRLVLGSKPQLATT